MAGLNEYGGEATDIVLQACERTARKWKHTAFKSRLRSRINAARQTAEHGKWEHTRRAAKLRLQILESMWRELKEIGVV